MDKYKLKDFIDATQEEVGNIVIEEILPAVVKEAGNDGESILDICEDIQIDFYQMRFIREKLERFGLLQSKNDEISDNNLEEIVKYLQKLEKERRKSKPGDVKIPKLKKVSISDSYKITPLGRQYLAMIEV